MESVKVVFHLHSIISCFPSDVEESKGKSKKTCFFFNIMHSIFLCMLLTQSMPDRHTAYNLAAKLINVVETWGHMGKWLHVSEQHRGG